MSDIVNAMTVDVEDYFQVSAFDKVVSRAAWSTLESRVERNTLRLLDRFERSGVTATFFVLGWVAERCPDLVRRLAAAGHEVASHGYAHHLVYSQTPDAFRDDVRRAKRLLEDLTGQAVEGYRAPSYSITSASLWALDVLIEEGYRYDSSIFPMHHDRYGIPDAPRHSHVMNLRSGPIIEVPGSTVELGSINLPIGGGGYFRLLPYEWTRWGIRRVNAREGKPVVFYLHPWEVDPEQPRFDVSLPTRIRHYTGLASTMERLTRLLETFRFGSVGAMLANAHLADAGVAA